VLGLDADGKPVTLKDIWPSDAEIDAVVKASVKPEQFRKVYEPMFAPRVEHGDRSARCTTGGPQSTYIRRPPYWEGALAGERTLRGMRPLAVLPTTSPPTTCRRRTRSCSTAQPANTWRRWACRKRTSTPTPPIAAIT
jgi:aconitase A